ncbi:histidine N-acetyltransferase-like [Oculina patagonica]
MEPLTFRPAQPGDFDDIVKLSEGIYAGHDYLQFTFHDWLQRDNLLVILAYSGDTLVGLQATFVVDDGRTAFLRAARIRPEFRGRGLLRQVREYPRTFATKHFPSLQRERLMTSSNVGAKGDMKLLECCVLSHQVNKQASQAKMPMSNAMEIKPCSREYFSNIILSQPVRAKLFPDNVIIANSCALEPLRSNVDLILQECNELFVDKCADDVLPTSISFGTYSPRVKFLHWKVSVYADDPVLFKAHLLCQFKRACEVTSGDFIFVSFQDRSFSQLTRKVMEEQLQLNECDTRHTNKTMILYERKLDWPCVSKL